jgi:hypothetical protein
MLPRRPRTFQNDNRELNTQRACHSWVGYGGNMLPRLATRRNSDRARSRSSLDLEKLRAERRKDDGNRLLGGIARGVVRMPLAPDVDAGAVAVGGLEAGPARLVEGGQDGGGGMFIVCHEWMYSQGDRSFPGHNKVTSRYFPGKRYFWQK